MAILTCLLYIRLAATLLRLCAIEILSINKPNSAGSLFHGTLVIMCIWRKLNIGPIFDHFGQIKVFETVKNGSQIFS